MLTVKHVETSGHENVTTADSVTFDPAVGENNEYPRGQVLAWGVPGLSEMHRFSSGIVYVMNARGSTVSTYNLNDGRL